MHEPRTYLTARYTEAVAYATAVHATQVRKGTDIPYLAHLLGVSSLVLEAGGTEVQAIAALLHDAVEDAGGIPRLNDIRARFGPEVAAVVEACSDSTDAAWKRTVPYLDRKNAYLDHLEAASRDALLVSVADKVHNARAIATDIQVHGASTLRRFNGSPHQLLHYYLRFLDIATRRGVTAVLTRPLSEAVEVLEQAVASLPDDEAHRPGGVAPDPA
jgi:(p)ppGpp synthase/HD superfamily hydrolase